MASESSFLLPHWTSCPLALRHREVEFWLVLMKVQQSSCICCYLTFVSLWPTTYSPRRVDSKPAEYSGSLGFKHWLGDQLS